MDAINNEYYFFSSFFSAYLFIFFYQAVCIIYRLDKDVMFMTSPRFSVYRLPIFEYFFLPPRFFPFFLPLTCSNHKLCTDFVRSYHHEVSKSSGNVPSPSSSFFLFLFTEFLFRPFLFFDLIKKKANKNKISFISPR